MRALVVGSSGGIGAAIVRELDVRGWEVSGLARRSGEIDIGDEASVAAALGAQSGTFDLVFVATGVLNVHAARPEKALCELDPEEALAQFRLNALGPLLVLKHSLGLLPKDRRAVFAALSARVGSIGDNRLGGWHSYRASKAALNQFLHGAAIELGRTHRQAIVAALHPGTVETGFTAAYGGRLKVTPDDAARNLLNVTDGLSVSETGGFFDAFGQPIPW